MTLDNLRESILIMCLAFLFVVFMVFSTYMVTYIYMELFISIPTAFNDTLIPTAFNDYLIT